jgi:thiol:disulfide interchange protein DsbC
MTQAKLGQAVTSPECKSPVKQQYELGVQLGVRGTPAIFTESGEQPGGYIPPKDMVKVLGIK